MYMELEDEFGDIVGKARRGQEIEPGDLAQRVGLTEAEIHSIENYELTPDTNSIRQLAQILGVHPERLQASAEKSFFPLYPTGRPCEDLHVEMLVLGEDFLMNGYVLGCKETGKGAVVDPGFDAEKLLKAIESANLEIELILLTHGHADHIGALSEISQATEAPALINKADMPLLGGLNTKIEGNLVEGETVAVGNQEFVVRSTAGHTAGGMSLIHREVAFVGDALFAGSLGGTKNIGDYEQQRRAVSQNLLSLDEGVTLYPGHGPATTVGEERANNPFFV
jgi:glyoxylase-like metal-dependent hydrolase (beta-lactamase superfamily II)